METFIELNKILNDIKNKGFIKQEYLDSGGAGKMLEKLLGKKLDNKSNTLIFFRMDDVISR